MKIASVPQDVGGGTLGYPRLCTQRRLLAVVLIASPTLASLVGCSSVSDSSIKLIDTSSVQALWIRDQQRPSRRSLVLIDPRASSRFSQGHIPGARNVKLPQIPAGQPPDPELAGFGMIVVYGSNPGDAGARAMTKRLLRNGYSSSKVRLYSAGLADWQRAGGAIETAEAPASGPEPTDPDAPAPSAEGDGQPTGG